MARTLNRPDNFINRELSQIEFNDRVLQNARDPNTPLLERLRFLCISCTNMDEFFEVRVASLIQRLEFGADQPDIDGLSPRQVLDRIHERAQRLVTAQYQTFNDELVPALAEEGIRIISRDNWTKPQKKWLSGFFQAEVLPVLSPLGLDPVHPFPRLLNKSLNFAVVLSGQDAFGRDGEMALVRAPRSLPRIVQLPRKRGDAQQDFVFLSSIIHAFVDQLFPGMAVDGCYQFRVTRNSELYVDEEEVENLAQALKGELLERSFANAVRLELAEGTPEPIRDFLTECFDLTDEDVQPCAGPVNLHRLVAVYQMANRPDLKYPDFTPVLPAPLQGGGSLFHALRRNDIVLHHPFDSFTPVIELIRQAVTDPNVLAIKQTLYRTGADSPVVNLLIDAARAGKDVTAVIELRARFDEQQNIDLANRLQEAGVQVVYGIVGHKTHAKMLLLVRREGKRLRRYAHLGTGNYHHRTALAYTDIGLLTADRALNEDVHLMFQQLTGLGQLVKLKRLYQSPFTLREMLLRRIRREIKHARNGRTGRIIARMNALTEASIIRALYQASQAGVEIDLLVRGACCLRPGVEGLSESIRVRSVIGRFLEHSRVYWFANDGKSELFASSADWMDRNLYSRVETCFPIRNPELVEKVKTETLDTYLADNCQAWLLQPDGTYTRVEPGRDKRFSAQEALLASRTSS